MDEHLLSATLFLDRAWDKGIPLWLALRDHGVLTISFGICTSFIPTSGGKCKVNIATKKIFPSTPGATRMCVEPAFVWQCVAAMWF